MSDFTRVVAIPHRFDHGEERSILALSKSSEIYDDIRNAGAQLVGGLDLIKSIQSGSLSLQDFKYILAHPNILPELSALRGLMKRKFPNPNSGTLDGDLVKATEKFLHGICYSLVKDEHEPEFGTINAAIGTVSYFILNLFVFYVLVVIFVLVKYGCEMFGRKFFCSSCRYRSNETKTIR